MPIIDDERGVLVLRLVYDGPPRSGKTTTLRTLAESLSAGIVTPAERDGRTLYFDWVDYVGGLFEGRRIRCQIVSVPGQRELAARRQHILESADAVVLVADSRAEPFAEAMSVLRHLVPWCRGNAPPTGIVVQANKRDVEGALTRPQVRDRLDAIAPIALTETVATSGEGVREAFVLAVRLALDRVRALSERGDLPRGRPMIDEPDQLLAELKGLGAVSGWDDGESEAGAATATESETETAPEAETAPAPETGAGAGSGADSDAGAGAGADSGGSGSLPEILFAPDPAMPGGFIWPPVDGRALVHEVSRLRLVPERNSHGDWSASGGGWRLHSRAAALFADVNLGRSALIEWARLHAAFGRLLSPGRALILADAGGGRTRLWQLVRVEAPLREALSEAAVGSPQQVVLALAFATMQLLRAQQTLRSDRLRLPCTLWNVGSDAMRQPIFVGLMPEGSAASDDEPAEQLIQRELGPVLVRLRRDRADYLDIAERLLKTSKTSSEVDGLRTLAELAAVVGLPAAG